MNCRRFFWSLCLIAVVCMAACGPSQEMIKKQSDAMRNLGEAYISEGNFREAIAELLKAEALYPDDPYTQNDLGLAYLGSKKPDLAVSRFQKSLTLKPDYMVAKNNLGSAYLALDDLDAAIACFKAVSGSLLYATPHFPLHNLGLAYFRKGDYQTAKKYFLLAIYTEPRYAPASWWLGRTYLKLGQVEDAISSYRHALSQAPKAPELYSDLGEAYIKAGRLKEARDAYERVIEVAPDNPLARDAERALRKLK